MNHKSVKKDYILCILPDNNQSPIDKSCVIKRTLDGAIDIIQILGLPKRICCPEKLDNNNFAYDLGKWIIAQEKKKKGFIPKGFMLDSTRIIECYLNKILWCGKTL